MRGKDVGLGTVRGYLATHTVGQPVWATAAAGVVDPSEGAFKSGFDPETVGERWSGRATDGSRRTRHSAPRQCRISSSSVSPASILVEVGETTSPVTVSLNASN
jgi:hypothetical protein